MSVFHRKGDVFVPSEHARGPWDPQALHGGAPAALIARAVEKLAPEMRLARLTMEFLGAVPLLPLSVEAAITRPGGRFQIAEASISAGGREIARARSDLLRAEPVDGLPEGTAGPPLATGPENLGHARFPGQDGDGFHLSAMDIRFAEGAFAETGPAVAWFRFAMPLVEGEEPSPAELAVAAADFGNGVSRLLHWEEWLFVNTDLTVHLHREPEGEWVALAARTILEPNGSGLAVSTLHDRRGPIGLAAQTLFVGPQ